MKNFAIIFAITFLSTGCLATRDQIKQTDNRKEAQQQILAQQQAQYQDLETEIRNLNGRIASLENNLGLAGAEKRALEGKLVSEKSQFESRLKIYEEALSKMEQQYLALSQKVEALQISAASQATSAPSPATASKATAPAKAKTNLFDQAEEDFKKKNFRQAIVNYQLYREKNPKGPQYSEATYKMGVCFQELDMNSEAAPFFNEVVEKFPKSKAAEKAKIRLKKK